MATRLSRIALIFAVALPAALGAQATGHTLSGRIADSTGAPLFGVRVTITELGRTNGTDTAGRFAFTAVPAGTYTLALSRIGLLAETRRVAVNGDVALDVRMRAGGVQLAAVQVTSTTAATTAMESPQPTSVVEAAELRIAQNPALGEVLAHVPGVRSLSMTTGIGKPVIRGMTHYRVVTLDNGQRTETQAWGHDHSPNVETAAAERVEVIKGPSSVLYGSDALGGVVNVIAPAVPDALDTRPFVRGQLSGAYNGNMRGSDGTLTAEAARGGLGARAALTLRSSGDMRTPAGALANTRNGAVAGDVAVGVRGSRGSAAARYVKRDERIEIYDDPVASPDYSGYQRIATNRVLVDATLPLSSSTRAQLNAGYEDNFRREFSAADAATPELGLHVRNYTGFVHVHHAGLARLNGSGTVGASFMASDFENRGSEALIPDSRTRNAAIYFFEQADVGRRWKLTGGTRYDYRTLGTSGHAAIGVGGNARTFHAVTGSVGVLYRLSEPVALVANLARGFRAPAAPDLFANGFHEGTRAFERGDPDLRVETSRNAELGVRISRPNLTAEFTTYRNDVNGYIYLRPFGSGPSAFDSLAVVQGDARLVGLEGRAAWRPLLPLTLQLSGDMVRGDNLSSGVPLTFIPPARVIGGVRLEAPDMRGAITRPYATATLEWNAAQRRIDPRDIATDAYALASAGAGTTVVTAGRVVTADVSIRNLTNTRYRDFMSRYKEFALGQGRAVVVRVTSSL